jgi:signal transduction histidine kinase
VRYISHEFRIPLNNIYLALSLISKQLQVVPHSDIIKDITAIIQSIMIPCSISTDILKDLLYFDSLEMAHLKPDFQWAEVKQMIRNMVSPFSVQAKQEGIKLHCLEEDWFLPEVNKFYVYVDEQKFSKVVRNLVSNALKFTKRGGMVGVRCSIIELEFTHKLRIEVHNTGAKIREVL